MAVVTFMDFPNGVRDSSGVQLGGSAAITAYSGAQGGGFYGRFTATDSDTIPQWGDWFRAHAIGFTGGSINIDQGAEAWRTITIRRPSGFSNSVSVTADEFHQSVQYGDTGVAPLNVQSGGIGTSPWTIQIQGGPGRGLFPDDPDVRRYTFGWDTRPGWVWDFAQPFAGGQKNVLADEWVSFVMGWLMDGNGNGWFEAWMRWPGLTDWRNVVPRKTGMFTCYASNIGNYPMSSLYGPPGTGGQHAIDYCHGAWCSTSTEAFNFANTRNGFTGGGTGGGGESGTMFGKNTSGSSMVGDLTGYKRGSKFTLSENATVSQLRGFVSVSATTTLKAVIYAADGPDANTPGTLKGQSSETVLPAGLLPGWNTLGDFNPPLLLPAGQYWLCTINGSATDNTYQTGVDIVSRAEALRADTYADGASDPWTASAGGGVTGTYDYEFAFHAFYSAATDTSAPALSSATVDAETLTLVFTEALDETSIPAASAFAVARNGTAAAVASVTVANATVTLHLVSSVSPADNVTVTYTAGATPLQDAAGNDVAGFFSFVLNSTSAPTRLHIPGGRVYNPAGRIHDPTKRFKGSGGGI